MLTNLQCRNAKARDQDYKLPDEKGLYLFVTTTRFKSWRLKYRITVTENGVAARKEERLTFGPYRCCPSAARLVPRLSGVVPLLKGNPM